MLTFPTSQGELIRFARGELTQAQFAKALEVNRSSLSRYESEALGAPASVINYCLREVADRAESRDTAATPLGRVLEQARQVVSALERVASAKQGR